VRIFRVAAEEIFPISGIIALIEVELELAKLDDNTLRLNLYHVSVRHPMGSKSLAQRCHSGNGLISPSLVIEETSLDMDLQS